jgi:hypothetical protein
MTQLSPTARLQWLLTRDDVKEAHETVTELLDHYESFLSATSRPEAELVERFLDRTKSGEYIGAANKLGDLTFNVLETVGKKTPFHRLLVV